jgi:GRAM domain
MDMVRVLFLSYSSPDFEHIFPNGQIVLELLQLIQDFYFAVFAEPFSKNSSEIAKGNLSLGKRTQARSGVERSFKKSFSIDQDERLLKGCHCYLYTTAGPIKGILLMSTKKIAFCSDKALSFTSPKGEIVKVPYKVLIPVQKVKEITPSTNINKPEEKYLHIMTIDHFEFWFSGIVKQNTSVESLQQDLSEF